MKNDFSLEEKAELRRRYAHSAPGHYRGTCPACSIGRRNSKAQCLSVTVRDHIVAACHHCDRSGATYLREDTAAKTFHPPVPQQPKRSAVKRLDVAPTDEVYAFLASRGISTRTVQAFSLVASRAYFHDLGKDEEAVALPYYVGGKVYGHKFRCVMDKQHVCDHALSSLFGIQNVEMKESGDFIITEGEFDTLAMYEAGVLNSTSVPNGASSFSRSDEDGTPQAQLGFLWDAREYIEKAKRVLIAVDADDKGEKLGEELARRIGRHRCWRVLYPEDCKDANDVLLKHGAEMLRDCVSRAEAWPVSGLYEADHYFDEFDRLYDEGFGERINTGINAIDEYFSVAPGMLTIVTGAPNAGKSNLVNQIIVNLARNYGYVSAICSFETMPAMHLGQLSEMLVQKHFFETKVYGERMTPKERDMVKPFLLRHMKFLFHNDGGKATVDSIIERIKTAVFRWGIRVAVIDPASYVERPANVDSETTFIGDMLARIRSTAKLYGIHVFFIAHPHKPQVNADGTFAVPKGYSISGSAHWFNHADHGLSVNRIPDTNEVELVVWKTRFSWLGKNGTAKFFYDEQRHLYFSDEWSDIFPYTGDDK